ncbi:MAG TPA: hypothetical protein VEL68_07070, partial [Thermodesulfobacteriota bacterium]|nr:hypothetical protein [Thermodesulfobacteriota bacterium]
MNKRLLMSIVALAISLAFVSGGMAQQKPTPAQPTPAQAAPAKTAPAKQTWEKFKGMIESVNEANKEVVVQAQKEKMSFLVGEHTKISQDSNKMAFSSLKKGMEATVEYKKEGNKMVAEWIDLSPSKAESKPATAPEVKKEMKKENPSEKATE